MTCDCGARLPKNAVECPDCGRELARKRPSQDAKITAQCCSWLNHGGKACTCPASMYPYPAGEKARGLCSWHWEVRSHGWDNTFSEFTRWLQMEEQWNACSTWTHYDAETLWGWTQGARGNAEEHPCRRQSCIVVYEQDKKKDALPPLTPEESAVKFREIDRILAKSALMAKAQPVSAVELAAANEGW